MERVMVIGASGGIGAALCAEATGRGAAVERMARSEGGPDLTDEGAVAAAMGALEPGFDAVVVAVGALAPGREAPEKRVAEVTPEGLAAAFAVNALGPMIALKHALRLLPRDRRCVFAALSARVGSIGDNAIGGWHSYRASKAALNQLIHGAAVEMARTHKAGAAILLHPGTVATPFTADYAGRHRTIPPEEAARRLWDVIEGAGPEMSGGFYDNAGAPIPW
jgi:NAD(P)-dependent dehydrogenase (short-subunit alcohol dehydrogenase family)